MNQVLAFILSIFKFHKKKILFLLAAIAFWFVVLFPYDDLSDLVTFKTTQMTQSQVYLQFDGLSFALLPQLGLKMENVLVEMIDVPPFKVDSLGVAPKFSSLFGQQAGILKAYGLFGGDAAIDVAPSNQLDVDSLELGLDIDVENLELKELSKFLDKKSNMPVTISGETNLQSKMYIDTAYKVQPKGEVKLNINNLDIPSSNIGLPMGGGAAMSMSFPALKLTTLEMEGNILDGILTIRKGKIGTNKNDLFGTVTGEVFFKLMPGGRMQMGRYDLKINLNISENLKRQLDTVLGFIDFYQGIGEKYKFASLRGVRYAMRLKAPNTRTAPQVSAAE